ncbi:MAG: ergothioneine biosynthesis protein EgtB [Pseudomonadota bacterium]
MADNGSAGLSESDAGAQRHQLLQRFLRVRSATERLVRDLEPEDFVLQAMPDASPVRWHLAHTSWFFETFVLGEHIPGYEVFDPQYCFLFNSYYEAVGERWARPDRGLLSRPTVREIMAYREAITEQTAALFDSLGSEQWDVVRPLIELGINHEEQHQELLCTDLKAAFGLNPVYPVAMPLPADHAMMTASSGAAANERWITFEGGLHQIGVEPESGFSFDNEQPRHKVWLEDFALHGTPVTAGGFLDFIEDGGYETPSLWLSDGWDWVQRETIRAPLYWHQIDGAWFEFTLHGLIPLQRDRILAHISAYEAFAYAAWAKARLPYEGELELALSQLDPSSGQWLDPVGFIHPRLAGRDQGLGSAYGSVWDWTQSAYTAYPGYRAAEGAIGEYNGKFMSSQLVLKGGSCATPAGHVRPSYRNFFPPHARWQFTGLRLARDV